MKELREVLDAIAGELGIWRLRLCSRHQWSSFQKENSSCCKRQWIKLERLPPVYRKKAYVRSLEPFRGWAIYDGFVLNGEAKRSVKMLFPIRK